MERKAVIDIGSNTIVLVIYAVYEDSIKQIHYESNAVHLVQYIQNRHLRSEGIQAAKKIFANYVTYCQVQNVRDIYADITECGRNIDNVEELIQAAKQAGIPSVRLLTGKEEAMCDFYGASLDSNLEDGLLIDIGGGSTELVRFKNHTHIEEACSVPVGCVRLKALPVDTPLPENTIRQLREEKPNLTSCMHAIGVGGTIRACRQACSKLHYTDRTFTVEDLKDLYNGLLDDNPKYWNAVQASVSIDRIPVLLPGLHMFVAIADAFDIQIFHNSDYGVREGFLLHFILKRV